MVFTSPPYNFGLDYENYKDGAEEGLFKDFYENGQLESKVYYESGQIDGMWEFYNKNEQLNT